MMQGRMMRATLKIADDVLIAAKALARDQGRSVGDVISDLARQSLQQPSQMRLTRNGLPLLVRKSDAVVTLDVVNALRDEVLSVSC